MTLYFCLKVLIIPISSWVWYYMMHYKYVFMFIMFIVNKIVKDLGAIISIVSSEIPVLNNENKDGFVIWSYTPCSIALILNFNASGSLVYNYIFWSTCIYKYMYIKVITHSQQEEYMDLVRNGSG